MEAAWELTAPDFTYSATALTQALYPQCQAKAQRDHVAEEWTSAAKCETQAASCTPVEYVLPGPSKPAEAKPQQNPKKQTHTHTKHRDSHRSKVTRSTSTLRLHKTSPGTDNTTAPARRKQEGRGISHFRYNCKRDIKEDSLWEARSLAFFFSFSFFKLSL